MSDKGNIILKVSKLSKHYDYFKLENVNFNVKKGKITGFIGINGAGKTTVIKSLAGLVIPDSGQIEYFGEIINSKNESRLRDRMAFLLDGNYYYPELTLNQMKNIVSHAYSHWSEETFKKYIQRFNLTLNQKIKNLSKGMTTQYLIALALSHNAELIIMDEPTSGLDPLVRLELMQIIKELSTQGISILFSSHITQDLEEFSDDIAFIHDGRMVFQKDVQDIKNTYLKIEDELSQLNPETKKLFLNIKKDTNKFIGIYNGNKSDIVSKFPNAKVTSAEITDVMIGTIYGGNQ